MRSFFHFAIYLKRVDASPFFAVEFSTLRLNIEGDIASVQQVVVCLFSRSVGYARAVHATTFTRKVNNTIALAHQALWRECFGYVIYQILAIFM